MLRTSCFCFFVIGFVILSRTYLCESRRLGPMEKKLHVNRDNLIAKVSPFDFFLCLVPVLF